MRSNNDLENLVPGLIVAWAALIIILPLVLSDARAEDHAIAHTVLICVFTVARIGHSVVYALKISTMRSVMYGLGLATVLGMLLNAIVAAFRLPG